MKTRKGNTVVKLRKAVPPLVLIILLAGMSGILPGCMLLPSEEEFLPPDLLKPQEISYSTVKVSEISKSSIQSILTDYCIVSTSALYDLSFGNRSGFLEDMEARLGQTVQEGDVLARLETGSQEIDIERQRLGIQKIELSIAEQRELHGNSSYAVRQLRLDLEMARLTLQQMEDELAMATITAPIDGEIVFVGSYKTGDFIPGRTSMITIADPTQTQFTYTGSNLRYIRHGMELEITVNDIPYPATVAMTQSTVPADEMERYRDTAIFVLDNPEDLPEKIALGSRHEFSILLAEKHDTLVLPREVVHVFSGQYYVQVLENGIRVDRDLEVGIITNREIEIINGITADDLIITGTE